MKFTFDVPGLINFGEGSSKQVGEIALNCGAKVVMCVYDQGVAKLATDIVQTIKDCGLTVVEFNAVVPNPPDSLVEEAAEIARTANVDVMVAVGGGSSIDTAKGINVLLTNQSPINQYAEAPNMVKNPTKPLIAIPTTSGTGSEVTSFSIITEPANKRKISIAGQFVGPTIAICDPLLTVGMPPAVTSSTGMDALTHAIEAYVSKIASIPTDALALKAISLIADNILEATNNGSNIQARTNMQLGSLLAGVAFNNGMVGLVHSIAHPLSAHCGVAHGVANAAVLSYVMEYNADVVPERTIDIGNAMGLDLNGLSKEEAIKKVVNAVQELAVSVKIPTLKEAGVPESVLENIAEDSLKEVPTFFTPKTPTKEDVLEILRKAY